MNPIIFFDEVDKISKTEKGLELENLLINLVDITHKIIILQINIFKKFLLIYLKFYLYFLIIMLMI